MRTRDLSALKIRPVKDLWKYGLNICIALAKMRTTDVSALVARSAKRHWCYGLGACIALAVVLHIYPLSFLIGEAAFFEVYDAAQHATGAQIFLQDEWRFPLLKTTRLNWPEGVTLVFLDGIPLAGMAFKCFAALLPPHFHYIGIWHLVAYVTQALGAIFLLRALGCSSLVAAVIGACFSLCMPSLTTRLPHTSLLTQSLLLFALGLYIQGTRQKRDDIRFSLFFTLLSALALLVHPYLFVMCFAIHMAFYGDRFLWTGRFRLFFSRMLLSLALFSLIFVLLGFTSRPSPAGGVDSFSMNLLSPFTGGKYTPPLPDATGGQGEGFNYLGLGLLCLFPVAVFLERHRLNGFIRRHPFFIFLLVLLFLYSLSNKIYIGHYLLLHYDIPACLSNLASTFRSTGRFFWPVGYTILFFSLYAFLRQRKLVVLPILCCALTLQVADTAEIRALIRQKTHLPATTSLTGWSDILAGAETIFVYPKFFPESGESIYPSEPIYLLAQKLSAHYGLRCNTGHFAHARTNREQDFKAFQYDFLDDNLYITSKHMLVNHLAGISPLPTLFSQALETNDCVLWDETMWCKKGLQQNLAAFPKPKASPLNEFVALGKLLQYRLVDKEGKIPLFSGKYGWAGQENWGVWSNGNGVLLPLQFPTERDARLSLKTTAFLGGEHTNLQVEVLLNDQKMQTLHYSMETQDQEIVLDLPKAMLRASEGAILITLRFYEAKSPLELGLSMDARKLGIGLREMNLTFADKE